MYPGSEHVLPSSLSLRMRNVQRAPQQSPPQSELISLLFRLTESNPDFIKSGHPHGDEIQGQGLWHGRHCHLFQPPGTVQGSQLQQKTRHQCFSSPGLQAQVTHGLGVPFLEKFQATMWSFPKSCTPILLQSIILIINAAVGTPKVSSDPLSPQTDSGWSCMESPC